MGGFAWWRRPWWRARPAAVAAVAVGVAHDCARSGHRFGAWLACACGQGIRDHADPAGPGGFFGDGGCAFEFRACVWCPADQERHIGDVVTVPDLLGVRRSGDDEFCTQPLARPGQRIGTTQEDEMGKNRVLRAIGKRLNDGGDGGIDTGRDGQVWCRICGRPVRSRLGAVCSRSSCHDRYLSRFGREDD